MRFTDQDLQVVAESRVFSAKQRWGIKRGTWNFIYSILPLVVFAVLGFAIPADFKGYSLAVAAGLAVIITIRHGYRMKKLVRDEFEYIKAKYQEDRRGVR